MLPPCDPSRSRRGGRPRRRTTVPADDSIGQLNEPSAFKRGAAALNAADSAVGAATAHRRSPSPRRTSREYSAWTKYHANTMTSIVTNFGTTDGVTQEIGCSLRG